MHETSLWLLVDIIHILLCVRCVNGADVLLLLELLHSFFFFFFFFLLFLFPTFRVALFFSMDTSVIDLKFRKCGIDADLSVYGLSINSSWKINRLISVVSRLCMCTLCIHMYWRLSALLLPVSIEYRTSNIELIWWTSVISSTPCEHFHTYS